MAPTRIVSLVPSWTELLVALGARDRLVGRTKFCTEPAALTQDVPAIGGTKNPDIEKILALRPDLVIANKEENRREDIEALEQAGLSVLVTDPNSVGEAIACIREIGLSIGEHEATNALAVEIETVLREPSRAIPVRVYVGVWHNPKMGLGSESYGHSMLEACGGVNVLAGRPRYPEVTMDELRALQPELILLPDEPFPFDAGHAALYGEIALAKVIDGKLLWWYGPRMPHSMRELRRILAEAADR
ncbi:MAG: helical backbone metal receptor [Dehalococcoidia bacterium]